jgi:hypothetical protein
MLARAERRSRDREVRWNAAEALFASKRRVLSRRKHLDLRVPLVLDLHHRGLAVAHGLLAVVLGGVRADAEALDGHARGAHGAAAGFGARAADERALRGRRGAGRLQHALALGGGALVGVRRARGGGAALGGAERACESGTLHHHTGHDVREHMRGGITSNEVNTN